MQLYYTATFVGKTLLGSKLDFKWMGNHHKFKVALMKKKDCIIPFSPPLLFQQCILMVTGAL